MMLEALRDVLAWAAVFNHALTVEEVHRYISKRLSQAEVEEALHDISSFAVFIRPLAPHILTFQNRTLSEETHRCPSGGSGSSAGAIGGFTHRGSHGHHGFCRGRRQRRKRRC